MDLNQVVAILRLVPLAVAFWVAFKHRQILPATIAVLYVAAILFGQSFLKWSYSTALFSTPLAYLVSWYMIKNVRSSHRKCYDVPPTPENDETS